MIVPSRTEAVATARQRLSALLRSHGFDVVEERDLGESSVVRAIAGTADEPLTIVMVGAGRVHERNGEPKKRHVRLTRCENALLQELMQAGGRPRAVSELAHALWGYDDRDAIRCLRVHVCGLRRKLEANPRRPSLVLTVRGGYRLDLRTEIPLIVTGRRSARIWPPGS